MNNHPFLIPGCEVIPDSDGPGRFRGGLGTTRDCKFCDHEVTLTVFFDSRSFPPSDLFAGASATPSRYILNPDGEAALAPFENRVPTEIRRGGQLPHAGCGGHGPPLERDPQLMLADVLEDFDGARL